MNIVKFNPILTFLYFIAFCITYPFLVIVKAMYPNITLFEVLNSNFYLLLGATIVAGFLSLKYFVHSLFVSKKNAFRRVFISGVALLFLLLVIKLMYRVWFYGPNFIFSYVILITSVDLFFVYLYYGYFKAKRTAVNETGTLHFKTQREKTECLSKESIVEKYIGQEYAEWIAQQVDIETSNIYATTQNISIEMLPSLYSYSIINLRRINDINRINQFFELVNNRLKDGGFFIGVAETIEGRRNKLLNKYLFPINRLVLLFDFWINRVLPKMKMTQDLYFSYTNGVNRPLSKAEVLGRLYSCGFEVININEQNSNLWFCVKKIKQPLYDNNPTYGPFVALRRVGKDKKLVNIYKLRTMYPYSEYIQRYVYTEKDYLNAGKAADDFRITQWGKFFRRVWLDELPMFINWIKGDVKLVGVRPLSKVMFETYPEYLQDKRTKIKPGLIPPYYVDMPKTQEELWESENSYLDKYTQSPIKTDVEYLFKALYNIFVRTARSK